MKYLKKILFSISLIIGLFTLMIISATVTVNLAARGKTVAVPDLRGLQIIPAIEVLEETDLVLKISGKEYNEDLPAGAIISLNHSPGDLVRKGRSVEAIISRGPKKVLVPDVRGDFTLRAESILLENGLKIGKISKMPSYGRAKDTIISQTPLSSSLVDKKVPIDLLISTGPPKNLLVMPDLIGRSLSETLTLVQEAGLEIGQVDYQEYPGVGAGTVVAQEPSLGTPVVGGDRIELTVVQTRAAGAGQKVRYSLLSFYVPEGLREKRVKVIVETEKTTYEALNENRPPGDRLHLLIEVEGETKAIIYIDDQIKDIRYY